MSSVGFPMSSQLLKLTKLILVTILTVGSVLNIDSYIVIQAIAIHCAECCQGLNRFLSINFLW